MNNTSNQRITIILIIKNGTLNFTGIAMIPSAWDLRNALLEEGIHILA